MVRFNLKATNVFVRHAFQVDLEEMTLYDWEWFNLYERLTVTVGELEIKRRTAIEYSSFTGSENRSRLFDLPISVLELSIRAANCLEAANVKTIGDLVRITERDLIKYRNFGRKSFNEVKDKLEKLGLSLGMTFN